MVHQRRFANAGFTAEQHESAVPGGCLAEERGELIQVSGSLEKFHA
jgi:hypothetical protein